MFLLLWPLCVVRLRHSFYVFQFVNFFMMTKVLSEFIIFILRSSSILLKFDPTVLDKLFGRKNYHNIQYYF